jgi:hypothetical protein
MCPSFTKLRLFLHKVFFIIDALFPPLHEMLLASRTLLKHQNFSHMLYFGSSSATEWHPCKRMLQGAKKMEIRE